MLQGKIVGYFFNVLASGTSKQLIARHLPRTMARHGKVHIAGKGDTIHCVRNSVHLGYCDASCVRVGVYHLDRTYILL